MRGKKGEKNQGGGKRSWDKKSLHQNFLWKQKRGKMGKEREGGKEGGREEKRGRWMAGRCACVLDGGENGRTQMRRGKRGGEWWEEEEEERDEEEEVRDEEEVRVAIADTSLPPPCHLHHWYPPPINQTEVMRKCECGTSSADAIDISKIWNYHSLSSDPLIPNVKIVFISNAFRT